MTQIVFLWIAVIALTVICYQQRRALKKSRNGINEKLDTIVSLCSTGAKDKVIKAQAELIRKLSK